MGTVLEFKRPTAAMPATADKGQPISQREQFVCLCGCMSFLVFADTLFCPNCHGRAAVTVTFTDPTP